MMVGFKGVNLSQLPIVLILGYVFFLVVAWALQSFGVIPATTNLGIGFALLAAGLGMVAAYTIIVQKGLSLGFNQILTVVILAAILIGILYFLPKLAPTQFQAGIVSLQSMFSGGW